MVKKNKTNVLVKMLQNRKHIKKPVTNRTKLVFKDILKLKKNSILNAVNLVNYLKILTDNVLLEFFNYRQFKYKFFLKYYLDTFFKFFKYKYTVKSSNFNYFIVKENKKQSFVSVLDSQKRSKVTYSIGLVLCTLGFKKNKAFKTLKKQHKGFVKYCSFSKNYIFPKYLMGAQKNLRKLGIIIKGRGKFTTQYSEFPKYLNALNTETVFFL